MRSAISLDPNDWTPNSGRHVDGIPTVGQRLGLWYGVWAVINVYLVQDVDLTDEQRRQLDGIKREYREQCRPYTLRLRHEAGPCLPPAGFRREFVDGARVLHMRGGRFGFRHCLLPDRYQVCSCHGDPWPCQEVDRDEHTVNTMRATQKLLDRMPGCCWACNEPFTPRQKSITYPGENLDLPGGQPVRFHLRQGCHWEAQKYELRWLAVDPRRERIITYPECGGTLFVHHDGSSECVAPRKLWGSVPVAADCGGHLTHDHGTVSSCVAGGEPCPLGCTSDGHPGAQPGPRPLRRDQMAL